MRVGIKGTIIKTRMEFLKQKYGPDAPIKLLASLPEEKLPASAAEVAEAESLHADYLAKVLQDLARADLLSLFRGRGAGFLLKRPAYEIRVLEILEAVRPLVQGIYLGGPGSRVPAFLAAL